MDSKVYLGYHIVLLQIGGQIALDNSTRPVWKIIHLFYRSLAQLFLIFYSLLLTISIYKKGAFEFELVAHDYIFLSGALWGFLKTRYYNVHENRWKNMILQMNNLFRYNINALEKMSMKKCINITNTLTICWVIFSLIFALFLYFWPLLSKNRMLPLPIWVPYDWRISPYFEVTYFMQGLMLWALYMVVVPSEILFVCVVLLTTEQFKLLGLEIRSLLCTTLSSNKIPRKTLLQFRKHMNSIEKTHCRDHNDDTNFHRVYDVFETEKFQRDLLRNLNEIIKFHQSLLLFCAEVEDLFSQVMLMFIPAVVLILIPLSMITITAKDLKALFPHIPMCGYVYVQMFISCYFGNFYTSEYEQIQAALYEMPWYDCSAQYKTNMKFFLHKLSVPISLRIGKFCNLNLKIFLSAVRTIISYCMVLYQLIQRT